MGYYSSYGIMEAVPTEEPGPGNRPLGVLALVAAAVCCPQPPLMLMHTDID